MNESGNSVNSKGQKNTFRQLFLTKDKHPGRNELQKQLDQERELRKFYEQIQRELLGRSKFF